MNLRFNYRDDFEGVKDNLYSVAAIMVRLARLDPDPELLMADFRPGGRGVRVRTGASGILPNEDGSDPCPELDGSLKDLICLCRAANHANIPSISGLAGTVMEAIKNQDEDWYGEDPIEEDETIRDLVKKLLLDGSRQQN